MEDNKWVLKSKTIWGTIIATIGAFAPVMKAFGYEGPEAAEVAAIGEGGYAFISAAATFGGLALAFYGRIVAAVKLWVVKAPVDDEPVA